jgi:hypothetical protein
MNGFLSKKKVTAGNKDKNALWARVDIHRTKETLIYASTTLFSACVRRRASTCSYESIEFQHTRFSRISRCCILYYILSFTIRSQGASPWCDTGSTSTSGMHKHTQMTQTFYLQCYLLYQCMYDIHIPWKPTSDVSNDVIPAEVPDWQ